MTIYLLEYREAKKIYHNLPSNLKIPGIDPYYVRNDAINYKNVAPVYLLYEDNEKKWIHNCLLGDVMNTQYKDIFSCYGYGGPVSNSEDKDFIRDANEAYLSWASNHNVIAEFLRFHPLLQNSRFYFADSSFNRLTVMVDLRVDDIFALYKKRTRRDIRRSYRMGVSVILNDKKYFPESFKTLYGNTMKRKLADNFYFFQDEYIDQLVNNKITFVVTAIVEKKVVASAIFLISGDYMEYHLSGINDIGLLYDANKALLHEAMLYGKKLGVKFAHLGGGASQNDNDLLLLFKKGFSQNLTEYHIGKRILNQDIYDRLTNSKKSTKLLHWR